MKLWDEIEGAPYAAWLYKCQQTGSISLAPRLDKQCHQYTENIFIFDSMALN